MKVKKQEKIMENKYIWINVFHLHLHSSHISSMSICKNMNIYSNESEEIYLVSTEKKMKNIFSVLKMIKDETSSREYIFTEISNKMMHILNGNINSIVITTWNKGNKQAIDSMERIKAIIHENKSDVIFINEFNFYKNQDKSLIKIEGFWNG